MSLGRSVYVKTFRLGGREFSLIVSELETVHAVFVYVYHLQGRMMIRVKCIAVVDCNAGGVCSLVGLRVVKVRAE